MIIQNLLDKCRRSNPNAGTSRFYCVHVPLVHGNESPIETHLTFERDTTIDRIYANCQDPQRVLLSRLRMHNVDLVEGPGLIDCHVFYLKGEGVRIGAMSMRAGSRISVAGYYNGKIGQDVLLGWKYDLTLTFFGTERNN